MTPDNINLPVYSRFAQVKDVIQGVMPIDYFFAKEMLNALILNKKTALLNAESTLDSHYKYDFTGDNTNKGEIERYYQRNLYHLFLALSASLRAGHSCLPLTEVADQHWGKGFSLASKDSTVTAEDGNSSAPSDDANENIKALSHAGFIFAPLAQLQNMLSELTIQASDQQLLVLAHNQLYMRRYFQFEHDLGQAINGRLLQPSQYNDDNISQCIAALFPANKDDTDPSEIDWQKVAVANAINKSFSVIAGGPGTGKTYTVTKLLAALVSLEQLKQNNSTNSTNSTNSDSSNKVNKPSKQGTPILNIALVAPTGKAAQRLSESIVDAIAGFKGVIDEKILAEIPTQAQTLHRLLGVIPNSPNFRHHENNRLSYDIVLIDEVSMVDLPLMTRVFRALKDTTKVILLGDADQLPSVAAGSVLADIAPRPHGGYNTVNEKYLTHVCQLSDNQLNAHFSTSGSKVTNKGNTGDTGNKVNVDYLSFLVKSRRFDGKGGIGLIANAVIKGDVKASWALLCDTQSDTQLVNATHNNTDNNTVKPTSERQLSLAQGELSSWLAPLVKQYYKPIESCTEVSAAFALLSKFRVLCATRQGDFGVENINEVIKGYLGKSNPLHLQRQQSQQSLYHGQPIMINENDYRLGLYNGDVGLIWQIVDQEGKAHLMACFEEASDQQAQPLIRQILPSRLPKFESVYAMTIHKTQGSEFAHVAMILSETQSEQHKGLEGKQQQGSKLLSRELLYTGITRAKKQLTIAANQRVWQQGVTGQVKRHSGLDLMTSDL